MSSRLQLGACGLRLAAFLIFYFFGQEVRLKAIYFYNHAIFTGPIG